MNALENEESDRKSLLKQLQKELKTLEDYELEDVKEYIELLKRNSLASFAFVADTIETAYEIREDQIKLRMVK
ncbi:hypothetical protein [Leptospira yasudae]|uniref:Uncharacterized protein n=1 Tax=Leptospira yasudae TaxID=2202201 RepID=A0A6N4QG38_9LEPT|nr:hypothetical protein [Leptospira yasudae]TGL76708.1 hypothetical protein EHQ72_13265 [Leptospira yasudae]TGL78036.1 hypothetical protein EHQ77_14075 [Leptospira yasudae]TGL82146.1 hypothetical protein EHQ83_14290 [Leptospira yasudae]